MHTTHVYLGPSLDVNIAKKHLPQAHYHPPVKCGDIIRLLRLEPKKIIIIDGLYENVPSVWHKEILLAIELGIEVWGAASMGALRAAELYHYGMNGFGEIFQEFKAGILSDDDELAVLHATKENGFIPVNDVMVNIRATCKKAYVENIISLEEKNNLVSFCKTTFYPYRSLEKASLKLGYIHFSTWVSTYGLVDVKKSDSIALLKHHQNLSEKSSSPKKVPRSVFIKELVLYANLTPFELEESWLPPIEKQLQALRKKSRKHYMLVAELAFFTKKLFSFASKNNHRVDNQALLEYIQQQELYSPDLDFNGYLNNSRLGEVYGLICQSICLNNITNAKVNNLLGGMKSYYDIDDATFMKCEKISRILLVTILSIDAQMNNPTVEVTDTVAINHFNHIARYREYGKIKFKNWFYPAHINRKYFLDFLSVYLRLLYYKYSEFHVEPIYFKWIYDSYSIYRNTLIT